MNSSYRWMDHVVAPIRSRADLVMTLLFLALIGGANLLPSRHSASQPNPADVALSAEHAYAVPGRSLHTCDRDQSRISSPVHMTTPAWPRT
jgi:hypothetical protein